MILILDDDQGTQDLLIWHLARHGFMNTQGFSEPGPFLRALDSGTIIIILDHYLLGNKTGLDIMQVVQKRHPLVYPIILSFTEDPRIIIDYLNHDAYRYVVKHINSNKWIPKVVEFVIQARDRATMVAQYFKNSKQ